jgi:hypothetical protein
MVWTPVQSGVQSDIMDMDAMETDSLDPESRLTGQAAAHPVQHQNLVQM